MEKSTASPGLAQIRRKKGRDLGLTTRPGTKKRRRLFQDGGASVETLEEGANQACLRRRNMQSMKPIKSSIMRPGSGTIVMVPRL